MGLFQALLFIPLHKTQKAHLRLQMKTMCVDGNASVCVCLCAWCVCSLLDACFSDTKLRPLVWYKEAAFLEEPSARRRASVWVSSLGKPVVVPESQGKKAKDPELLLWSYSLCTLSYLLPPYPTSLTSYDLDTGQSPPRITALMTIERCREGSLLSRGLLIFLWSLVSQ